MKDRILAAWSVLRGTHKAVPMAASWFVASPPAPYYVYPTNWTGPPAVKFVLGGNS